VQGSIVVKSIISNNIVARLSIAFAARDKRLTIFPVTLWNAVVKRRFNRVAVDRFSFEYIEGSFLSSCLKKGVLPFSGCREVSGEKERLLF
jgi:hypothetical protein